MRHRHLGRNLTMRKINRDEVGCPARMSCTTESAQAKPVEEETLTMETDISHASESFARNDPCGRLTSNRRSSSNHQVCPDLAAHEEREPPSRSNTQTTRHHHAHTNNSTCSYQRSTIQAPDLRLSGFASSRSKVANSFKSPNGDVQVSTLTTMSFSYNSDQWRNHQDPVTLTLRNEELDPSLDTKVCHDVSVPESLGGSYCMSSFTEGHNPDAEREMDVEIAGSAEGVNESIVVDDDDGSVGDDDDEASGALSYHPGETDNVSIFGVFEDERTTQPSVNGTPSYSATPGGDDESSDPALRSRPQIEPTNNDMNDKDLDKDMIGQANDDSELAVAQLVNEVDIEKRLERVLEAKIRGQSDVAEIHNEDDNDEAAEPKWCCMVRLLAGVVVLIVVGIVIILRVVMRAGGDDDPASPPAQQNYEPLFPMPAGSPTSAPTVSDFESLKRLLTHVSDGTLLDDETTSQHQALLWLWEQEQQRTSPREVQDHKLVERYILALLYNDAGGRNWTNSEGFLSSSSVCDWFGVSCGFDTVDRLDFANNGMNGPLPNEITYLTMLASIDVSNNQLYGQLPTSWSQLNQLHTLDLQDNLFSGTIPTTLSQVSNLETAHFDNNMFTGTVLGIQEIVALETLTLSRNGLEGTIPEIATHGSIQEVDMSYNNFYGLIPESFYSPKKLKRLDLSNNQLSGKLSTQWGGGALQGLEVLRLNSNKINGTIPLEIGKLSNLQELWISDNSLSGTLPRELGGMTNLKELFLSGNPLTGAVPVEVVNLPRLETVTLNRTDLDTDALNMVCSQPEDVSFADISADCGGFLPKVDCKCCEICCDDTTGECVPQSKP